MTIKTIALLFLALWSGVQLAGPPTTASSENRTYRDERIKVAIPANWSSRPVYESSDGDRPSKDLIGVLLSNGPFDFYLLSHYGQASGVKGGRFGEVAAYVVPWLKSDDPWSCLDVFKQSVNRVSKEMVRVDLILDPKPNVRSPDPSCQAIPREARGRAWAGAYYGFQRDTNLPPGFFINTPLGTDIVNPDDQMVFAASFRMTTADRLPLASDAYLRQFLAAADRVVAGIKYQ